MTTVLLVLAGWILFPFVAAGVWTALVYALGGTR